MKKTQDLIRIIVDAPKGSEVDQMIVFKTGNELYLSARMRASNIGTGDEKKRI